MVDQTIPGICDEDHACYWCDEPTTERVWMSFGVPGTLDSGNSLDEGWEAMCPNCQSENGYRAGRMAA